MATNFITLGAQISEDFLGCLWKHQFVKYQHSFGYLWERKSYFLFWHHVTLVPRYNLRKSTPAISVLALVTNLRSRTSNYCKIKLGKMCNIIGTHEMPKMWWPQATTFPDKFTSSNFKSRNVVFAFVCALSWYSSNPISKT